MSPMSQAAQNLNWLITNFVDNAPGVSHTVVVSADGLLLAMSEGFPRDRADQLAAVASGLTSLTAGASRIFEGGTVAQTVVEMERGFLFLNVRLGRLVTGRPRPPGVRTSASSATRWRSWSTARARCSRPTCAPNSKAVCSTDRHRHHPSHQITVRPPQSPHRPRPTARPTDLLSRPEDS
ncbi:hypothetical protein SFUMM280S_04851 [Streptomyces fumanus]